VEVVLSAKEAQVARQKEVIVELAC
jgi:hypothetical protein